MTTFQWLSLAVAAVLVIGVLFFLYRWQRRTDLDPWRMMLDDAGKPSATRAGVMLSLLVSTWVIVKMTLDKSLEPWHLGLYLFTWSGALIFREAVQKWNGQLPFGPKG